MKPQITNPLARRGLRAALVWAALEALGKLVSEQARGGSHPLGFREWGLFLEAVARQSP